MLSCLPRPPPPHPSHNECIVWPFGSVFWVRRQLEACAAFERLASLAERIPARLDYVWFA